MTSVIDFMTSILFCRTCHESSKCDGYISCPWLSPHDEANCLQPCLSLRWPGPIPCDCNKPRNMWCGGQGRVCYRKYGKFLILFCFCKNVSLTDFGNVTIAVKLNKVSFVSKDSLIVTEQLFL